MKALSIKQPWADLILYHGKDIENRTWRLPNNRTWQYILIHAGQAPDGPTKDFPSHMLPFPVTRLGALLGTVKIVGCVHEGQNHPAVNSRWFNGPFGFVLRDPVPFDTPIPYKGQLGFFDVPFHVWCNATTGLKS